MKVNGPKEDTLLEAEDPVELVVRMTEVFDVVEVPSIALTVASSDEVVGNITSLTMAVVALEASTPEISGLTTALEGLDVAELAVNEEDGELPPSSVFHGKEA